MRTCTQGRAKTDRAAVNGNSKSNATQPTRAAPWWVVVRVFYTKNKRARYPQSSASERNDYRMAKTTTTPLLLGAVDNSGQECTCTYAHRKSTSNAPDNNAHTGHITTVYIHALTNIRTCNRQNIRTRINNLKNIRAQENKTYVRQRKQNAHVRHLKQTHALQTSTNECVWATINGESAHTRISFTPTGVSFIDTQQSCFNTAKKLRGIQKY